MYYRDALGHRNRETSAAPMFRVLRFTRKFLAAARIFLRLARFTSLSAFYSSQLGTRVIYTESAREKHYQTRGIEIETMGRDLLTSCAWISSVTVLTGADLSLTLL